MAVLPSVERNTREVVKTLFSFLDAQGQGDYLGEVVTQLQHSLQTATLALHAGADNETVIGSLLHDVGRFIPAAEKMPSMISPDGRYLGRGSHEVLGERYLRQLGFSEMICQLVGAHVMAKRYLCAVDDSYHDGLSWNSKNTLKYQVSCASFSLPVGLTDDLRRAGRSTMSKSRRPIKIPGSRTRSLSGGGTT